MPLPTNRMVHVDSALTNISVAHLQSVQNFVARSVFPNIPVTKQSGKYFTYSRADFNRDEVRKRAPGTESAGNGFRVDADKTFFCDVFAFHKDVSLQTAANQDVGNSHDDASLFVTNKFLIFHEKKFATDYLKKGVWGTDIDGVASSPSTGQTIKWSDSTSGDPIRDIEKGKASILEKTGIDANVLVLGYNVYSELKNHPDIVDRVKYSGGVSNTTPALVTPQALASIFEVDRVVISKAVVNNAAEGLAENSQFIIGNKAFLAHAAPRPGLLTPSAGYTFSWDAYSAGNEYGVAMSKFFMEHLKSDRVEGEMTIDMGVVSSELGYFFNDIV